MLRSVLVAVAHPDDETMLAGGTLTLLAQHNAHVHIVCATRGEGGELGEPPVAARAELGAVREAELRCAARTLGAASVRVLGYIDPLIGPDDALYPFQADFDMLAAQLRQVLRETDAQLVLTHGSDGEYGHPAHQLMHRATLSAVNADGGSRLLYSMAANVPSIEDRLWNENEPAHLALDVRPWLDTKEAAALCHQSQHALFKRRRKLQTVREALRTTEAFHRHLPTVPAGPPRDAFADLLRAAGAWVPT